MSITKLLEIVLTVLGCLVFGWFVVWLGDLPRLLRLRRRRRRRRGFPVLPPWRR